MKPHMAAKTIPATGQMIHESYHRS